MYIEGKGEVRVKQGCACETSEKLNKSGCLVDEIWTHDLANFSGCSLSDIVLIGIVFVSLDSWAKRIAMGIITKSHSDGEKNPSNCHGPTTGLGHRSGS